MRISDWSSDVCSSDLRRRLDTVDAGTEFGDVEIDLENALLRPQCFDQDRVAGFDAFAKITAARPQEQILRGLLADGRCAARALRVLVVLARLLDRLDIATLVVVKLLVF